MTKIWKLVLIYRNWVRFNAGKNFVGLESGDPLSGVSAAIRRGRTLYRHGRTCFQEVGCDFVAKIPVTILKIILYALLFMSTTIQVLTYILNFFNLLCIPCCAWLSVNSRLKRPYTLTAYPELHIAGRMPPPPGAVSLILLSCSKLAGCKYLVGDCTVGTLGYLPDRCRRMKKISDSVFQISFNN